MKLSNQSGQSLVEILIAIGIAAVLIGAATFSISIALRSSVVNQSMQIATGLAQELITKSRVITDAQWHDIYDLSKGTSTQYYAAPSSTRLFIIDGVEGMLSSEVVNGLVGHWKFDEATSTTVYDLSGNVNNGTLSGATRDTAANCKISTCLSFDGDNDYVNVSTTNTLRPNNITVAVWVKSDTSTWNTSGWIISHRTGTGGNGYIIHPDSGAASIRFLVGINDVWKSVTYTPADITVWHHYVMTHDGTTLNIFVDGVEVGSTAASGDITYNGTLQDMRIGSDTCCGARFGDGAIDDVRIYNRALSANEISDLYKSQIFTRYFSIENVSRDTSDNIVTSGGNDDPSTQKVIAYVEWSVGAGTTNFKIVDYFTRWKNKIIDQSDWSGGSGQEGPITVSNDKYATSSEKIDATSAPGSFKLTL